MVASRVTFHIEVENAVLQCGEPLLGLDRALERLGRLSLVSVFLQSAPVTGMLALLDSLQVCLQVGASLLSLPPGTCAQRDPGVV